VFRFLTVTSILLASAVSFCSRERTTPARSSERSVVTTDGIANRSAQDSSSEAGQAAALLARADSSHPDMSKVNLFGYYYLAENVPSWCADIDQLNLFTIDVHFRGGDSTKPEIQPAPLWGFIRLKADSGVRPTDFRLTDLKLNGRTFAFATQAVDSVSYDFSGAFLKLGDFPNDPPNGEIVLAGHLRKLRSGRVLYEADVKFSYFAGD
jgi:hypothetical protein